MNIDLNDLAKRAYKNACNKGFHDIEYPNAHWKMLIITELSEVIEADRNKKRAYLSMFEKEVVTPQPHPDKHFTFLFNKFIKGTVEEELADTVIRILDYAGMKGLELEYNSRYVNEMQESCEDECFTESIFNIIKYLYSDTLDAGQIIHSVFGLAKHLNIDLGKFIELKMKYNEFRERLHGKAY